MRKWTSLMVGAALCWPILAFAVNGPPPDLEPVPVVVPTAPAPKTLDEPVKKPEAPPLEVPDLPPVKDPVKEVVPVKKTDAPPVITDPPPSSYSPPPLPGPGPVDPNPSGPMKMPKPYAPSEDVKAPRPLMPPPPLPTMKDTPLPKPTPYDKKGSVPDISDMPNAKHPSEYCPPSLPPGISAPVVPPPHPPGPCEDECATGPSGCFFIGEALWLRPRRSDPLAYVGAFNGVGSTTVFDNDTHFGFAFRAGLGCLDECGFYTSAIYTYYDHRASSDRFTPIGAQSVFNTGPASTGLTVVPNSLATSWDLQYQNLDVMAGAWFSPVEALELRFGAGAKLAQIDQEYTSVTSFGSAPLSTSQYKLDVQGAGPRVGLEGRLFIPGTNCLSIYARSYGTLLLGHRTEEGIFYSGGTPVSGLVRHDNGVFPVLEVATGLECNLFGGLIIGAGYEFNYWYDLGTTAATNSKADISLDGVFVRVTLLW